jgi:gas vesicle protein GvpL/GvpF
MEINRQVLYLFCFARPDLVGVIEGTGVNGDRPLLLFPHSPDLCAIVSEVPQEDFCGPAAEQRMQQLAWMGPRALRHEAVVEMVMHRSPVLPVRFGTLFSSPGALEEFLGMHRETISLFLCRVANQEEWSVKGLLDRKEAGQALISASLGAEQAELAALPPGTRYFREQRARAEAQKRVRIWLDSTTRLVAGNLMREASDFCECPVVSREDPEGGREIVLNWAFLLPQSGTSAFRARIDQLNASYAPQGLVWEMSGPWPPYRFVPPLLMGTSP